MELTKEDLQQIKMIIDGSLYLALEPLKEQVKKIDMLPTKEEYFNSMDRLMVDNQNIRVEQASLGVIQDRQEEKIKRLEIEVGITTD